MNALKNGYMQLVYYSLFNGFVGVFVKMAQGLDTIAIVFFRALITVAFVGLIAVLLRQGGTLRLHNLRATMLVGIFQGLMTVLIMGALRLTSVSNALFLLYTAPVFSVLLARIFLKERIAGITWIGISLAIMGIFFIVDPTAISLDATHNLGNLMALGAGLALAAMTVAAKPLSQKVSGYYIVFWQYLVIAVLALPFAHAAPIETVVANWWQLGGLGIVCTGIAYTLYMRGVRRVPTQHVLVIASLEPLVGTLIAGLLLHESLSYLTLIGALFIMAGAYGVARARSASEKSALPTARQSEPARDFQPTTFHPSPGEVTVLHAI
jgi:drug/metabolite transporter (DMT)-like permease